MKLELDLKQQLLVTPQLIQMMEVLQMDTFELMEYLEKVAQDNPVLDVIPSIENRGNYVSSNNIEYFDEKNSDRKQGECVGDNLFGIDDYSNSLREEIISQIDFSSYRIEVISILYDMIEYLDGDGYLDKEIVEIFMSYNYKEADVLEVLGILQNLEPAGIGARTISECICLQLERTKSSLSYITCRIVREHIDDVAKSHYGLIAKSYDISIDEVRDAVYLIKKMNPRPCMKFKLYEPPIYIKPDLYVFVEDGEVVCRGSEDTPTAKINSYYQLLLQTSNDKDVINYLSNKIRQAEFAVNCIKQRNNTVRACVEEICKLQTDFFKKGIGHLRPLTMKDIGELINVNESTVSRAIRNKYLECDFGIFPLQYFFSVGFGTKDANEKVSAEAIKNMIKKIIKEEPNEKPYSDQKLVTILSEKGIEISRRTITKYREEMGILNTLSRKKLKDIRT